MRFLGISSSGINQLTGNVTIVFSTTGSLKRPGVLGVDLPSVCPASMLQASNGTLLLATGLGPMQRMRYKEYQLSDAGVPAPSTQPSILQTQDYASETQGTPDPLGTGKNITTINFDFSRFGPVAMQYSRSAVQWVYTPEGRQSNAARVAFWGEIYHKVAATQQTGLAADGTVLMAFPAGNGGWYDVYYQLFGKKKADGTNPTPTVVYPYDLWVNQTGSVTVYVENEDAITGQYQCFQRWVDKDGYVSDPGPLSALSTVDSRNIIKYQNVDAPIDTRITDGGKRQIWRNTAGQVQNFYLDIETTDMTSTEFTSNNTDEQLALKDVITFTDVDGYTIPYLYAQPPSDKPFIAELRGRIFAVGSRRYSTGSVRVVNGSADVEGVGTDWTSSLSGRRFIAGNREYTIKEVDVTNQIITLATTYAGLDDNFALYVIAPFAAEELVIRWSDPTAGPESWPLTAQLLLPQDGDTITGLVNYGDALYILKTRNIYRFNFTEDPAIDGEISPAAKRGCVNQRCAVTVEGACLMLDREGIHAFTGGPNPQHISLPVGDLFREETNGLHLNFQADLCMWHAAQHQELSTVSWYVALAGDMFPQHALCYDYRRSRLWIEEYPVPITSSCYSLAVTGRPLLGSSEGRILAADTGSLDLISPGETLLTIAAVNSPWSITVNSIAKECEGVPVVITTGSAAGTDRIVSSRVIASDSEVELQFLTPMSIMPSKGDKVQLGGIKYRLRTAAFDAERMDGNNPKAFTIKVDPTTDDLAGSLLVYKNGGRTPSIQSAAKSNWGGATRNHIKSVKNIALDMSTDLGMLQANLSFPGEKDIPQSCDYQFVVCGSSGEDRPVILEMRIDGAS